MTSVPITFDPRVALWDENTVQDEHGTLWRKDVAPGAAHWSTYVDGSLGVLVFSCPCGCGAIVRCPIKNAKADGWTWDGNNEKPTLSPSILRTVGCRWHGFLRNGVFERC